MTADTILIALLTLIFMVLTGTLTFIVKASINWGRNTEQLKNVVRELGEIKDEFALKVGDVINAKERDHAEIRERLTFLERRELTQRRDNDKGRGAGPRPLSSGSYAR